VGEWFNPSVLKTEDSQGSVSSNLTASANYMSLKYENLQPWVDMLCDALENRGSSSSGIPNEKVYPYAQKYREFLADIRAKKVCRYDLEHFLNSNFDEIMSVTNQPYRTKELLVALRTYFYKEFMTPK
jgi:hypothetical protein